MKYKTIWLMFSLIASLFAQNKIEAMETQMNKNPKKVLVIYASEAGSTEEVAIFIKDLILEADYEVDLCKVDAVKDITEYDVIMIGSPIYVGKWKKEASNFVENNAEQLQSKKVFYFLTCMNLTSTDQEKLDQVPQFLTYERGLVEPISEGRFAGVINPKKLSFFKRMMIKLVKAPEGDFRDWEEIANWTRNSIFAFEGQER